jgi:hypothetical protein
MDKPVTPRGINHLVLNVRETLRSRIVSGPRCRLQEGW